MAKRFIDTGIWTQNKWFRKLEPKFKLFWLYLISQCDNVGVWEEDIDLASFVIGYEYSIDSLLIVFKDRIKLITDNRKWWITDFVKFQYGQLQENDKNKPHQSYIKLLKEHNLYIDYQKGINTLIDKDKDKEEEKEIVLPFNSKDFGAIWNKWKEYKYKLFKFKYKSNITEQTALDELKKLSNGIEGVAIEIVEHSIAREWEGLFELTKKNNASQEVKPGYHKPLQPNG